MKINKSEQLFKQSQNLFPGGVNSPVRAFKAVGGTPLFIKKGYGSHIIDEDDNEYIDYVGSWGPCILGHANEKVVKAVQEACQYGLSFGAPTKKEFELGTLIKECIPSIEMMRFVSSGTEAVMSAIRAARGYTHRDKIIKFKGCYHGHSDGLLVKAGSGAMTDSVPDSDGIPNSYTKHTLIADYNNINSVKELFSKFNGEIAAAVIEPVAANMGLVPPEKGFLEFLRQITSANGTVLIFDEVITGFRMGIGGAQKYYNIIPDITTLGKVVGGGMPIGVYGGKKEIIEAVSPVGKVYQAGTLSGNPIATAAGIATIKTLMENQQIYNQLEQKADILIDTLKKYLPCTKINRVSSLFSVFFTQNEIKNYEDVLTCDTIKYSKYFHYLLDNGIYIAPSQFEIMFLSAAHSQEDIEKTCKVIKDISAFMEE